MKYLFFFIFYINLHSQDFKQEILESFELINSFKIKSSENYINTNITSFNLKELLKFQVLIIKKGKLSKKELNHLKLIKPVNLKESVLLHLNLGDYYLHSYINKDTIAITNYDIALRKSIISGNYTLICQSLQKLINYNIDFNKNNESLKKYLLEYKKYSNKNEIQKLLYSYYSLIYKNKKAFQNNTSNNDSEYFKVINQAKKLGCDIIEANTYYQLGLKKILIDKIPKNAIKYYNKSYDTYKKNNNFQYIKSRIHNYFLSIGAIYFSEKKYKKSIFYFNEIKRFKLIGKKTHKSLLYEWLRKLNDSIGNYEKAYKNLLIKKRIDDEINQKKSNIRIAEIEEKYQNEKNEKELVEQKQKNLVSETKRKQNQNLFYGALLVLLSGAIIAYLNLKNSRKKRLLAEQQKELEKQKNLTLIKEQEITTINAMIDGQEKERIRIAEDLHDNIGSVLATLKLHFENLKLNREKKHFNQEKLYNKTEKLIDETYYKVRSIAHAKNAGVIANQGLLVAIKMMAEKISSANKIKIHVVDYGLDNRLENNIEITVFRIIQELITNIIKHAEASEATINISLFDTTTLNIIIEDNGKGFNSKNVKFNEGMGLGSIKKRVTHLKGTFQIDSTLNKGTSILINIPLFYNT